MKVCIRIAFYLLLAGGSVQFAHAADSSEWQRLNAETLSLVQQAKIEQASVVAMQALRAAERDHGANAPQVAKSLYWLASIALSSGRDAEAETYFDRAMAINEKNFGNESKEYLEQLNQFAMAFQYQGAARSKRLESIIQRVIQLQEKLSGPEHADVAMTLVNLGLMYNSRAEYAKAVPVLERAVKLREKNLGEADQNTWTAMSSLALAYDNLGDEAGTAYWYGRILAIQERMPGNNDSQILSTLSSLAWFYYGRKNYEKAESYFNRVLSLQEKMLGPEHPEVALTLNTLGWSQAERSDYAKALSTYTRAIEIRKKAFGETHALTLQMVDSLDYVINKMVGNAETESRYQHALQLAEKILGPEHPYVARRVVRLAVFYQISSRLSEAEPLFQRGLLVQEKKLGPEDVELAKSLSSAAIFSIVIGRYELAEMQARKAVGTLEKKLGPNHAETANATNVLGMALFRKGNLQDAETYILRANKILEGLPANSVDLGNNLYFLAVLKVEQGRYADAEPLFLRALALTENNKAHDSTTISTTVSILSSLALLYWQQGRMERARPLFQRYLAVAEKNLGPDHIMLANGLVNMATMASQDGRNDEAITGFERALRIFEKNYDPEHPSVATVLSNLAVVYQQGGRFAEAEKINLRVLAIRDKPQNAQHPDLALTLYNLGYLYFLQNRPEESASYMKRAIPIFSKALGPEHAKLAMTHSSLSNVYLQQGRDQEALLESRTATSILKRRFTEGETEVSDGGLSEQRSMSGVFLTHLNVLNKLFVSGAKPAPTANESFEVGQLARASSVGQSMSQVAARFAQRGDALAQLVREQQDTREQLARLEMALTDSLAKDINTRKPDEEARSRLRIELLRKQLIEKNRILANRFPDYQTLVSQAPVSVAEIQKLLRPEEAMLVYSVGANDIFAWAIRSDRDSFVRLAITPKDLNSQVQFLRNKLQPNVRGQLPAMTPATSSRLYQQIFAPLESNLTGAKRIFLVPDGALQSLPFTVLGAGNPAAPEWLVNRYAFATLPSVSALRALRSFSKRTAGKEAFVGFGDPVLDGEPALNRNLSTRNLFATRSIQNTDAGAGNSGIVDVELLRKASQLPDTADELRSLAKTLHGSPSAIYLQANATETKVKELDLSHFRFVAFATHGVMVGELSGVAEPGLVLTPPKTGTVQDDGYLSASEVAQLQFNADWILLSACNTAAADGAPGAEGLSGLAKAFFFAGARSLLVSNWQVSSVATKQLITDTMSRYVKAADLGKPEALQQAMKTMMAIPEYQHPFFWSAFIVVGD